MASSKNTDARVKKDARKANKPKQIKVDTGLPVSKKKARPKPGYIY